MNILPPSTAVCPSEVVMPEDLPEFRETLEQQLDDLLSSAERTVGSLLHIDTQSADPIDRASIDIDCNYTLRIRDRESRLIKKIKKALAKIDDGTFGICEECEEPISVARLKARPVAAYCIRCKTIMEAHEKTSGAY